LAAWLRPYLHARELTALPTPISGFGGGVTGKGRKKGKETERMGQEGSKKGKGREREG